MNTLRMLRKLGLARALDPCHGPEGSWALGTRMCGLQKDGATLLFGTW